MITLCLAILAFALKKIGGDPDAICVMCLLLAFISIIGDIAIFTTVFG